MHLNLGEKSRKMNNFRQGYYASLGVKSVDIKPSVETALSGDLLQLERLNKLCLWVRIPHMYRPLVWKVLLAVLPCEKSAFDVVTKLRKEQFFILQEAIAITSDSKEAHQMVNMLFLEQGYVPTTLMALFEKSHPHLESLGLIF